MRVRLCRSLTLLDLYRLNGINYHRVGRATEQIGENPMLYVEEELESVPIAPTECSEKKLFRRFNFSFKER